MRVRANILVSFFNQEEISLVIHQLIYRDDVRLFVISDKVAVVTAQHKIGKCLFYLGVKKVAFLILPSKLLCL